MTKSNPVSPALSARPLVSVVMNCLNSAKYLREAMDSVFAQTCTNWEIIFWDNVSTDESAEIAQSYGDERVRYFKGEVTVPVGQARNLALAKCRGELIAILDCDDLWYPEKLEKQVPLFLADEQVGIVYSDTLFFNSAGKVKQQSTLRTHCRGHCFPELLNAYMISLETVVFRKAALDSLDHWVDEGFEMIEDYDLFVRLGVDWKIDYVPEVLAKWRVHGESGTWQSPDQFVEEKRRMLEQLERVPKIREQYESDLKVAWKSQAFEEARVCWKNGKSSRAREILREQLNDNWKARLIEIATFFPYPIFESTYRFVFRSVTPT